MGERVVSSNQSPVWFLDKGFPCNCSTVCTVQVLTNINRPCFRTDPNPDLVGKYGVYGLPTLLLFKDGAELVGSKREGALSKDKIKQYLETFDITP